MKRILYALLIVLALLLVTNCAKEQFTITVISNNPACSAYGGGTFDKGTVITISAIPSEGYIFSGWNDGNNQNPRNITVEYNTTYVAMFESSGGGGGNGGGGNGGGGGGSSSISAPTGVSASIETYEGVDYILVEWNSVSNAVKYNVYYSTTSNGSYQNIGYTEENYGYVQASNSDNYFKVTAVNNNGDESSMSAYAYCHYTSGGGGGGGTTTPNAPTGVTATNVGSSSSPQVKISWNSVSNATSYKVYRSSSASGSYSQLGSSTSSTYAYDNNPMSGYNYYKVKAVNSAGESSFSSYATFNNTGGGGGGTSYSPCPPTVNVSGTSSQTVSWSSSTSAGCGAPTSYEVYHKDPCTSEFELIKTASSSTHSYSVPSSVINPGVNMYAVKAINNEGSAYNTAISSEVPLSKPSSFSAQKYGSDQVKFTWSAVSKATGYQIFESSSANGTYTILDQIDGGTTTQHIRYYPMTSGTTRYFKIKAIYSCGYTTVYSDLTTYKSVTF